MLRKLILPAATVALLGGCVMAPPYGYRADQGDYYYGTPSVEYREVGPYGSYYGYPYGYHGGGYPGGGYWSFGLRYGSSYGYPYSGYPYYGYPYGYRSGHGYPYYGHPHAPRPPVIVRPPRPYDGHPNGGVRPLDRHNPPWRSLDQTGRPQPQPMLPSQPQSSVAPRPERPAAARATRDDGGSARIRRNSDERDERREHTP
jgi:hypothetical protein